MACLLLTGSDGPKKEMRQQQVTCLMMKNKPSLKGKNKIEASPGLAIQYLVWVIFLSSPRPHKTDLKKKKKTGADRLHYLQQQHSAAISMKKGWTR